MTSDARAPAVPPLSAPGELRDRGDAILGGIAASNLPFTTAFWLLDPNLGEWRFHLVTALGDTLGRRETYRWISDALGDAPGRVDGLADQVRVMSPRDDVALRVAAVARGCADPGWHVIAVTLDGDVHEVVMCGTTPAT